MNHDNAHCADFLDDCPEECFRAQLVRDLKRDPTQVPFGITSWMSFMGDAECLRARDDE